MFSLVESRRLRTSTFTSAIFSIRRQESNAPNVMDVAMKRIDRGGVEFQMVDSQFSNIVAPTSQSSRNMRS